MNEYDFCLALAKLEGREEEYVRVGMAWVRGEDYEEKKVIAVV